MNFLNVYLGIIKIKEGKCEVNGLIKNIVEKLEKIYYPDITFELNLD
ncbi:MAG: hypothetical protein ABDH49_05135 [Candidatus Hydrothermales bacterium]